MRFILLRKDLSSIYAEYTESASYNMDAGEKKDIKERNIEETRDGHKKIERKICHSIHLDAYNIRESYASISHRSG